MKMINDYVRLILFCAGLLLGIQIPALTDQYTKRVDAKLLESSQLLAGFQLTAERYFKGDIQQLIQHYKQSNDAVFKQDAQNIQFIFERVKRLKDEFAALQGNSLVKAFHVLVRHDSAIMQETLASYSYIIILDPMAFVWGFACALLLSSLVESLMKLLGLCIFKARRTS
ncbi:DUF2937 family protein [Paraglaciecola hydrolytica]|uniref:DUF2937 domain-containing protein n=1 Tax=Paraglaciecola hydrolytica TaxID=1799789 RepID=A0A136A211_9ALTE|nr:DUF2937 family protein [Paraglaciecola hydrolytica]KXI29254.1 hypothetical protein AX660_14000 [Paraglaciecola hydrolytica]